MRPLGILFLTDSLNARHSGRFWSVNEAARALQELGHRAMVVGPAEPDAPAAEWDPVPVFPLWTAGPSALQYMPGFQRWLTAHRAGVDIVSIHDAGRYSARQASDWCRHQGVPYVITPHGVLSAVARRHSTWKSVLAHRLFAHRTWANAQCIQALSEHEYIQVRQFGLHQPTALVPNGSHLSPPSEDRSGNHDATRRCAFLGRIHPIKGLENLIDAWTSVRPPGWQLFLAGPGDQKYKHLLQMKIFQQNLGDTVRFHPEIYGTAKSEFIKRVNLAVLPSNSEAMSMSTLEFLAAGIPMLVTNACGMVEIEQDGAGLSVDNSVSGLAAGLQKLTALTDHERHGMGAKGRAIVAEHYQWPAIAQQLTTLYNWMLDRETAPPWLLDNPP